MDLGTKAEQVAAILERELMNGFYRTALPAQKELAVRFGVSLGTVRHAVSGLTAKGLLSVRPRWGMHATAPREWTFDQMLQMVEAHRNQPAGVAYLAELLQARRLILGEVVALACLRRTAEDIGTVSFLVWDLEQTVTRRPHFQVARCERDVLDSLAAATGSVVLTALHSSLERIAEVVPPAAQPWAEGTTSLPLKVYRMLSDYLERRACEPARQLMLEALLQANREMERRFVEAPLAEPALDSEVASAPVSDS